MLKNRLDGPPRQLPGCDNFSMGVQRALDLYFGCDLVQKRGNVDPGPRVCTPTRIGVHVTFSDLRKSISWEISLVK